MSSRRWITISARLGITGAAVMMLLASTACADKPAEPPPPIFAAAHSAIAAGRLEKSKELGFVSAKGVFTEVPPQGAVLIGFDVGVGKFFDIETVYALRPIYLSADGEMMVEDHGLFRDRRLPKDRIVKSKVIRTEHIRARPGYAVGGLRLRSGLLINGLSVTFMRITGRALDPSKSYDSDWVGDRTGGSEAAVDGEGAPVLGVFGRQDEDHVHALGLYFMKEPLPAKPAAPPAKPPAVPPAADKLPRQTDPPPADRAEPEGAPFEVYRDDHKHYTFMIPRGWRTMPPAEMVKLDAFAQERMPGFGIHYDGGLRRSRAAPFAYPYVLIQVTPLPSRSISYDELEWTLNQELPVAIDKASGALGDLVRNTSVGSCVLDRDRNLIVFRVDMDAGFLGKVQGLSVGHIGAGQMVSLHCYAQEDEFHRLLPLFTEMNNSFQFDEGHEFKAVPPSKFQLGPAVVPVAVGLGCALLVASLVLFMKKGQAVPKTTKRDPSVLRAATAPMDPALKNAIAEKLAPQSASEHTPHDAITDKLSPTAAEQPILDALPASAPEPRAPASNRGAPPPFFTATATNQDRRVYRVYALPLDQELLFLDAGATASPMGRMLAAPVLLGGLLGGYLAGQIEKGMKEQVHIRLWQMDIAEVEDLLRMAEQDRRSFRAPSDELANARLDAPSFWDFLWGTTHGWFHVQHPDVGKLTLQIQTIDDMKRALDLLPGVLGDRLEINAVFDRRQWKFVRRS
jgi:hypothetical protein